MEKTTHHQDPTVLGLLMGISGDIGEIKTGMRSLNEILQKHIKDDDKLHTTVETRLGDIENSHKKVKWMAAGASTVITAFFALIGWAIDVWVNGVHR